MPVRDHHAGRAARLALEADARRRQARRPAVEQREHRLDELRLRDRAAAQLEVDLHVVGDRRRGLERGDELGARVDERDPLLHVGEVAQRLDPARRRAGADRDQQPRLLADLVDPLGVVRGRDRALDERDVVRARRPRPSSPRGSTRARARSAIASSSSSQSSSVSWQPSQEENFQTASFGFVATALTAPAPPSARSISSVAEHGAVAADQRRAELAVAAVADAAAHVALHRDVDALLRHAALEQRAAR